MFTALVLDASITWAYNYKTRRNIAG